MVVNPSRATAAGQARPVSRWWWYCAKAAAGIRATPEAQVTVVVNPTARRRSYRATPEAQVTVVVNPSRATAADKPVVVVLRQGGRRYPGNSGGPGNGGGKSNCAAAFLPATPEAQVTVVVNPSRATAADKPVVVVLRQGGRRYPGNSGGPGNGGGKSKPGNCGR